MRVVMIVLFLAVSLAGCGMHEFKAGDPLVALAMKHEDSKASCYQAQAMNGPDYSKLGDMAIVVIEQGKAMVQMMGMAMGKNPDPCSGGTTLNDVVIADSNNRNATAQVVIKEGAGAAKFGLGAWFGYKAVDSIGQNSGVKTFGDNSPASKSTTITETNAPAINAGDGSASSGTPAGTGTGGTSVDSLPVITAE